MRPTTDHEMIRRRMFDSVLSIRPLPPPTRPSAVFIQSREVVLAPVQPTPLNMHRRERLLARLEEITETNRVS